MVTTNGRPIQGTGKYLDLDKDIFDTTELEELEEKLEELPYYNGKAVMHDFHRIVKKLNIFKVHNKVDYKLPTTDPRESDQYFSEQDLLSYFVKNGIPRAESLEEGDLAKLEEAVKFANVDRLHLPFARSQSWGISNKILTKEEVQPVLARLGFERDPRAKNRFFQPGGMKKGLKSMTLGELRVFVRENGIWSADGGRSRVQHTEKRGLRYNSGGATSETKLPKYTKKF
ncbi:expressed unknown protein [Seminavis robusta]|uniref:Uncharacterized protein n=1 Tax=Seminavis robusta TaxID=568900 RepID=A0A9N8DYQ5_9STRA|nr:expressed unknown protein [Seminavis robusta]|eukprot:Sro477_g150690.1 n/a (229) ;mRNA; r:11870-12556